MSEIRNCGNCYYGHDGYFGRIATYLQKIRTPRTRCSLHEEFFSISHVCDSWREDE